MSGASAGASKQPDGDKGQGQSGSDDLADSFSKLSSSSNSPSKSASKRSQSTSSTPYCNFPENSPARKRLQRELMTMIKDPPDGIALDDETREGADISRWSIDLTGPEGTLYEGETYSLVFKFGPKYPFDSPEVVFSADNVPIHPHIYSNGHICLSILTDDWSPALSVEAVCLSILSMLASAKEKKRPPDNSFYIRTCHKNPKKTRWWYHDDNV